LESQQTDEQDLMPYPILVEIERHAILYRKSPIEVYHAMKGSYESNPLKIHIKKFFRLWSANQWKRVPFSNPVFGFFGRTGTFRTDLTKKYTKKPQK